MNAMTGISMANEAVMRTARILSCEGADCTILQAGVRGTARRAFSCLVAPEPGDVVLVAQEGAQHHVLAVLERPGGEAMRVALPDGATLAADGGRLTIAADTLALQAREGQVAMGTLGVAAARVDGQLGRVGLVAEAIETLAQRIIGRFRRSYRFVEESEHLRARDIDQRASGHLGLKGDTATLQGGIVVKVDGAQIHMG